jgi:hypothetical protein
MTVHTLLTENARLRENVRNLREVLERCDDFVRWVRSSGGKELHYCCDEMDDKISEIMEATKE